MLRCWHFNKFSNLILLSLNKLFDSGYDICDNRAISLKTDGRFCAFGSWEPDNSSGASIIGTTGVNNNSADIRT